MMGLVTGDALGNAIQFMSREEVRERGFSVLRVILSFPHTD